MVWNEAALAELGMSARRRASCVSAKAACAFGAEGSLRVATWKAQALLLKGRAALRRKLARASALLGRVHLFCLQQVHLNAE